jgi:ABC-type sulfate transport system permease component
MPGFKLMLGYALFYLALIVFTPLAAMFASPATSASAARAWSAGINWYLNKKFG